jgi:hypothetical protein
MSGQAPELPSSGTRLWRRLADLSDLRISAYMLVLALGIAAAFYLLNPELF